MNEKIIITNTKIDLIDFDIEIKKDFYLMTNEDNALQFLQNRINSIHNNLNKLYYVKKMRFYILEYVTKILFDNKPIIKDFYLTINLEDLIELLSYNFNFPNPKIRFTHNEDSFDIGENDFFLDYITYDLNSNYGEEEYSLEEIMCNDELAKKEFEEYKKNLEELEKNKKSFLKKYGQLAYSQMEFVENISYFVIVLLNYEKYLLEVIKENNNSNLDIIYNIIPKEKLDGLCEDLKDNIINIEDFKIMFSSEIKSTIKTNFSRNELLIIFITLWRNGIITESKLKNKNILYVNKKNSEFGTLKFNNPSNLLNHWKYDTMNKKEIKLYRILDKYFKLNHFKEKNSTFKI